MVVFEPVQQFQDFLSSLYTQASEPDFWADQIGWIARVVLTLVIAISIGGLARRGLQALLSLAVGDLQWRFAIPRAAKGPLGALIWLIAFSTIITILQNRFGLNPIFTFFGQVRPLLYISIFGWFFLRLNRLMFREVLPARDKLTPASRDLGQKIGSTVVLLLAGLLMLPYFGVSLASLLTVGGIGGLVIGFASKDMLANYIGAIMLHFDQPFQVGDWVRVRERNVEGVVESIGWRQVVIRDMNKQMVYVPNSLFGTIVVENPGRMSHRRIKEYLTLRYEDLPKIPALVADVQHYLETCGYFDSGQDIVTRFEKFSPSSLDIYVSALTPTTDFREYMKLREDVMLNLAALVTKHGASFAYPTQTLLLQGEPNP